MRRDLMLYVALPALIGLVLGLLVTFAASGSALAKPVPVCEEIQSWSVTVGQRKARLVDLECSGNSRLRLVLLQNK